MPWDFGAGVAAAAGAGAELLGDSIKRERDLQDDVVKRKRNLADATDLEALKAKVEEDKRAAIAKIVAGVSRTKDTAIAGSTQDGSSLGIMQEQKTEAEYQRSIGDAFTKAGLIEQGHKAYETANRDENTKLQRDTQAAAQKSADERWRDSHALSLRQLDETIRHNRQLEAKTTAEKISPAAKAQLEMASVYVGSAHRAEAEAGKALDAIRKNVAADPAQVQAAEAEYKISKAATANALKQYDEIGAAHFGDQWKKASVTADAASKGGAPQDVRVGGKVIGQASTQAEADALVAAYKKSGGKPTAAAAPTKPVQLDAVLLDKQIGGNGGMIQTRKTL